MIFYFIGHVNTPKDIDYIGNKMCEYNNFYGWHEVLTYNNLCIYNDNTYVIVKLCCHHEDIDTWCNINNIFNILHKPPTNFWNDIYPLNINYNQSRQLLSLMDMNNETNVKKQILKGLYKLVKMLKLNDDVTLLICDYIH